MRAICEQTPGRTSSNPLQDEAFLPGLTPPGTINVYALHHK